MPQKEKIKKRVRQLNNKITVYTFIFARYRSQNNRINSYRSKVAPRSHDLFSHECDCLRFALQTKRDSRNQIYSSSFTFREPSHVSSSRFNVSMFSEKLDFKCCVSSSSFAIRLDSLRYFLFSSYQTLQTKDYDLRVSHAE